MHAHAPEYGSQTATLPSGRSWPRVEEFEVFISTTCCPEYALKEVCLLHRDNFWVCCFRFRDPLRLRLWTDLKQYTWFFSVRIPCLGDCPLRPEENCSKAIESNGHASVICTLIHESSWICMFPVDVFISPRLRRRWLLLLRRFPSPDQSQAQHLLGLTPAQLLH